MKLIYPAVFYPFSDGSGGYVVEFPDLPGCVTEGKNLEDAFENATDAASGWVLDELEEGNVVPKSSDYDSVERREGGQVSMVLLDMDAYAERYRSQKAHGRAHQTDCGTDYGRLKQNRMRSSGVKHLTGKFEGAGTSHYAF